MSSVLDSMVLTADDTQRPIDQSTNAVEPDFPAGLDSTNNTDTPAELTDAEKMDILDDVMDEAELLYPSTAVLGQSSQADTVPAVPPMSISARPAAAKELWSLSGAIQETGGTLQVAETEPPAAEVAPELESYLATVEDQQNTPAKQLEHLVPDTVVMGQPVLEQQLVRVLPLTSVQSAAAAKKSARFSVRWLYEWSQKLIKVFKGKVMYLPST